VRSCRIGELARACDNGAMYSFLKLRQLGAAIDLVMLTWARALRLRAEDVSLILLVGHRKQCAVELATWCGRTRQQVHRNLHRLELKKVLVPQLVSAAGRVQLWALGERGTRIFEVLQAQVKVWDAHLAEVYELESVMCALEGAMLAMVNRPSDSGGWEQSLRMPRPLRENEAWALEANALLEKLGEEIAAEPEADAAAARAAAREAARLRREEEETEKRRAAYRKMWDGGD
jgi:hypothetical protein